MKPQTLNLLGRNVWSKLGFFLSQKQGEQIKYAHPKISFQKRIIEKFPHVNSPITKSENHVAKSEIKNYINPLQHIGQRVPLHLTEKIDEEIKHLLNTNESINVNKCADDVFISPIVITVKDKTIKLTSNSKLLNDEIVKNKYRRDQSKNRCLSNVLIPISALIILGLSSAIGRRKTTASLVRRFQ